MTANPSTPRKGGVLPTATDGALRLRYLREVGELLWPAPARAEVGRGDGQGAPISEFILVPDAKRPRLLVPAGAPRAAAAAVRRYAEPGSAKLRITLGLLSAALASGFGGLLMRDRVRVTAGGTAPADNGNGAGPAPGAAAEGDTTDTGSADTIETYLRGRLGTDLVLSLHIGPARANRKPVLQLLTRRGRTTGFAKLGVNELTRSLVRAERDSLRELATAGLRHTTVPSVLHHGTWNGLEVLVQSPLPVWERRAPATAERLAATMREIAEVGGVRAEPLRGGSYWTSLAERLAGLDAADDNVEPLRAAFAAAGERADGVTLRFGSWHGDLTPWNMATLRDTVLVWDWERFAHGVPIGFDAVHYDFQGAVVRQRQDPQGAIAGCVRRAPALLAPFGVDERAARLTVTLYLIDIATRYLQDGQAEAGARLGALGQWLLPVLVGEVEAL